MNKAIAAGVPAITNAGANPGVSNLMAATLIHDAQTENRGQPQKLRYNYFTSGSGGTGPGVLSTTFYLLADEAVTYHQGEEKKLKAYSDKRSVSFGEGIGERDVFLLNVPEVASARRVFGVPTIDARFGTAPFFWNWTLLAVIKLLPVEILKDRRIVQFLSKFSYPFIRAVDVISGEKAAIRVDLECSDGYNTSAIFSHQRLAEAAGTATAAFALAVLEGSTKPGVWYPEEPEGIAVEAREKLLRRAAEGAMEFQITKSFCRRKEKQGMKLGWIN
ncbi:Saccharopine dehydrogenase [Striga hermonthica]|uniref:Saccharopine dehydrogenase n=1 Tax=Striga hermonthica TaxID=68872 RepID=A0A9N7MHP0_STRHE|nr:Saccharopine dehydrogenase [Striga hermonthica]